MNESTTQAEREPELDEEELGRGERMLLDLRHQLAVHPILGPLAVLVLASIVFSIISPAFYGTANMSLVLQQVMVVGVAGLGQTIIILTAGIDLSVGSLSVLVSIIMASAAVTLGFPGWLALLTGLIAGCTCGLINGVLVVWLKLPPFIGTLGTLSVYLALGLWLSGGASIRGTDMPPLMTLPGQTFAVAGTQVAYGSVLHVLLVVVMTYCLQFTTWGKHVYAVGDAREAARLAGIQTGRVLLSVYVVAGALYTFAAWVLMGRNGAASPQAATTLNLDSITAVVIGGTSLFGGRGRVVGTLLGALIVGVFRNGLALAGVQVLWQNFAVGLLVIAAVALDQWIRKDAR